MRGSARKEKSGDMSCEKQASEEPQINSPTHTALHTTNTHNIIQHTSSPHPHNLPDLQVYSGHVENGGRCRQLASRLTLNN